MTNMMGLSSPGHWLILLLVILLVFGTGKLRNLGSDLGNAVKGFKKAVNDDDDKPASTESKRIDTPHDADDVNRSK